MRHIVICTLIALAIVAVGAGSAVGTTYDFHLLASFNNASGTGSGSFASLIIGANGDLYGTAPDYGAHNFGTVFKLDAATNTLSALASFDGPNTGSFPYGGLLADANGDFYGTTYHGGPTDNGTVFKLDTSTNTLTALASFNFTNGRWPYFGGVIADAAGNLYGTTEYGGTNNDGTVFKVAAGTNALSTLYTFDGTHGAVPLAGLIADASGNLYGTTSAGGATDDGTVFQLAAGTNVLTTLASFNGANGNYPSSTLIADAAGNLYGTTQIGGANNFGTIFKVAAGTNTLTTLHSFDGTHGSYPYAGVIADADGNLYGTTLAGGANNYGTVFQLAAGTNTLTTLHTFDGANGFYPRSGLVADDDGNLYGTTRDGGAYGAGTVYKLTRVPEPSTVVLFGLGSLALLGMRRRFGSGGRDSVGRSPEC